VKHRVLVADDEPLARQRVRRLLRGEPDAAVVGEAVDGAATVEEIRRLAPDVVFLDVEMPGLDGFAALGALPAESRPVVVFVTAFTEYALPAFDAEAADYVLKPIDAARFRRAWERARERLSARALAPGPGARPYLQRFLVPRGESLAVIPVADVRWLESQDNYVGLHTASGVHLVRSTLSGLEAHLDPALFARIRRTALVNCRHVQELRRGSAGEWNAVLRTGEALRVAASHRAAFLARLRGVEGGA
jgi:two-component system LytT family response regulator